MTDRIQLAAEFARMAHESIGQRRKFSNEPYIVHPMAVARIVGTVTQDEEMICAAWLHDVVEDTPVELGEIVDRFGKPIGQLVDDLTDIGNRADGDRQTRLAIDRAHTSQACPRAKTIKLADIIDNLTGIESVDEKFARRFIREKESLLQVLHEGDQYLFQKAQQLVSRAKACLGIGADHPAK